MKRKTKLLLCGGAAAASAIGRVVRRRSAYSFYDKSVLITGGSRGLGLVMARVLAEEGARLTLMGRNAETLLLAQEELQSFGASVVIVQGDVRDRTQATAAVDAAVAAFGAIDVVINNAGVIQVGPLDHMTLDDFEDALAIHAWGPLFTMLAAIPYMRKQGSGRIVNISSIGGKVAVPHLMPYTMSKFALAGLSEAMRAELSGDGIRVTSVYPGLMRTGSHVNAYFKGKHEKEFTWFSLMSAIPAFSISANRAAKQIVEAARYGRPELVITTQARMAVWANALFPDAMARMMKIMNGILPGKTESADALENRIGWDSMSEWAPSLLTRLADRATGQNNEYLATA